ncbi:MAG: hypothetical protein IJH70_16350 [Oscillospiraceae bacterium]|nr:hypothetical protein [Oscillospiraceae bacterium]
MILEFMNLSQEEIDSLYAFEEEHPDCVVREISASFDGYTAIQLLTPENIASASQVLIAAISMIGSITVAKNSSEATKKAAEASAKASVEAAKINADAMLEAVRINASAALKEAKAEPEKPAAATKESQSKTKKIYVQLNNGEKRLIPAGATIEQIKEIIEFSDETDGNNGALI